MYIKIRGGGGAITSKKPNLNYWWAGSKDSKSNISSRVGFLSVEDQKGDEGDQMAPCFHAEQENTYI